MSPLSSKVMSPAPTAAPATKTAAPAPANKNQSAAPKSSAGRARNYEIQRQSNGRWLLDSVADDKDVAIAMAQALLTSNRAPAEVRVSAVQIKLDGSFSEVTVFHATAEEQRAAASKTKAGAAAVPAQRSKGKGASAAPQRAAKPLDLAGAKLAIKASLASLGPRAWLMVGGFVFVWCAIFYVWHQPQTPWAFDSPAAQTVVKSRSLP